MAVRTIDVAEPIDSLLDLTGYAGVRLIVLRRGRALGQLDIAADGESIGRERIIEAIATGLGLDFTEEPVGDTATSPSGGPPGPCPAISVVVCTRDRPADLARCLDALVGLDYPDFEVVVVDNDTHGGAADLARARGLRAARCAMPGASRARNAGVRAASSAIIAFTDDDAVPHPRWLHGVADALSDPAVDAVTGPVLPFELESHAQRLFELYGGGMCRGFEARRFTAAAMTPDERIATQAIGVGANMAVRRDAFERIGGFDTGLGGGTRALGGEDLDLFHRLLAAGSCIAYEPASVIFHRHRHELAELRYQLYGYGRAFGVYLIKAFATRSVPRRSVVSFTIRRWLPWCIGRVVLGLLGRHRLPSTLLRAELRGALSAPFAARDALSARRPDRLPSQSGDHRRGRSTGTSKETTP